MKRPAFGGRPLPAGTGRCFLCRHPLGDPRDGSIRLLLDEQRGRWDHRLVCRDEQACRERRRGEAP